MKKRLLAITMAFCMILTPAASSVLAEEGSTEPAPIAADSGEPTTIPHGASGLTTCHRLHDTACGYSAAVEGSTCNHIHNDSCGYTDDTAETPCDMGCVDTDSDGMVDHAPDCAFAPAVEGTDCTHTHDDTCGYSPAVGETPCTHSCEECNPTPKCACTVKCTLASAENGTAAVIDLECPVCAAENVDLEVVCEGVTVQPTALAAPKAAVVVGDFTVTGGVRGTDYIYVDKSLVIITGTALTIVNTTQSKATTDRIVVACNGNTDANITLAGVNINTSTASDTAAFSITSGYDVYLTLADGTENKLKSGSNCAGLQSGKQSLKIQCESSNHTCDDDCGALEATCFGGGSGGGAGIGGGNEGDANNITIYGGNVTATGSVGGAGIGGGNGGSGAGEIYGGNVTATGNGGGAGIGGGKGGSGSIGIYGGTVTATGNMGGAGIGIGSGSNGDSIIHIKKGNIVAIGNEGGAGIGIGSGKGHIIVEGGTVSATGTGIGVGIGSGGDNITIDGGSIKTNSTTPIPSSYGKKVFPYTLIAPSALANTEVSGLWILPDLGHDYGIADIKTNADSKLYVYLPEDTTDVIVNLDNVNYGGKVISDASGNRTVTLSGPREVRARVYGSNYGTVRMNKDIATVGDEVTVTVPPNAGYYLSGLLLKTGSVISYPNNPPTTIDDAFTQDPLQPSRYTFIMPSGEWPVEVQVGFAQYPKFSLSIFDSGNGRITVENVARGPVGTTDAIVTISVKPEAGYYLSGLDFSLGNIITQTPPTTISNQFTMISPGKYTFAIPMNTVTATVQAGFTKGTAPIKYLSLTVSDTSLVISDVGYSLNGGKEEAYTGAYELTSNGKIKATIRVISGTHTIILNELGITNSGAVHFSIEGTANVVLELRDGTSNILTAEEDYAALQVAENARLIIQCSHLKDTGHRCDNNCGSLNAQNPTGNGAGIGGGNGGAVRNITISGGNVTAIGGNGGAGIGGGGNGIGNGILISGGNVTATGGNGGAGVGGGYGGSRNDIIISGGMVTATGGDNNHGSGGTTIITGGSVLASSFSTQPTNGAANVYKATLNLGNAAANAFISDIAGFLPDGYDLKDLKTDGNGKLYFYLPIGASSFTYQGKRYTAEINAQGTAVYQITSNVTKLTSPTSLTWDSTVKGKATWGAVSNASSYIVQLYKSGNPEGEAAATTQTSYDFTGAITSAGSGSYTFAVTAIGDGKTYSNSVQSAKSGAYVYTKSAGTDTITADVQGDSISPFDGVPVNSGANSFGNFSKVTQNHTNIAEFPKNEDSGGSGTAYNIISGTNGSWTQGTNDGLTFICSGEFSKFSGIWVDGSAIAESSYTAQSGSTIVTLKPEYLKTLSAGTHQLCFIYTDGYVQTSFTITAEQHVNSQIDAEKSPQTDADKNTQADDSTNTLLWMTLLFGLGGVLTALGIAKKKRTQR